jgi:hypothetical protein
MSPAQKNQPDSLTPNVVANFPMKNPEVGMPTDDDPELDKIMHDVGQEVKKVGSKPKKHRFLWFGGKSKKAEVPFSAKPIEKTSLKPAPMPPNQAPLPVPAPALPKPDQNLPTSDDSSKTSSPKNAQPAPAPEKHSVPAFVIFVTILFTGILIAVAYLSYKNG